MNVVPPHTIHVLLLVFRPFARAKRFYLIGPKVKPFLSENEKKGAEKPFLSENEEKGACPSTWSLVFVCPDEIPCNRMRFPFPMRFPSSCLEKPTRFRGCESPLQEIRRRG